MATYKVIQDIEAEDKFVGPFTLKQFIFAMGGLLFGYLSFIVATKGIPWAMIATLPPSLFGFFMAFPWSKDQPTDVWVLAKIRFRLKPRVRIWNQAGIEELVTITVPKKEERVLTNNLSQVEVKSRLKALADTIDSRGWVIKNAPLQASMGLSSSTSDRLIDPTMLPQQVPDQSEIAIPDMLDQHGMDNLLAQRDQARKAELYEKMNRIRQGEPLESINQPQALVAPPAENKPDEQILSASLKAKRQAGDMATGHLHTIPTQPVSIAATVAQDEEEDVLSQQLTEAGKAQASVTDQASPDILKLAQNNDLNVSTIARQINSKDSGEANEVVISLH